MWKEADGDRRKEYRHEVWIEAKVIAPKTSFRGMVANISGGGLEIHSPIVINPKTKLMITLELQEDFVFHGTVIWTLGDFVDGHWVYRVGIKTDAISFRNKMAASAEDKYDLIQKILPNIRANGTGDFLSEQMSV